MTITLDELISQIEAESSEPLERLGHASDVATRLGAVSDHLLGHFVDQARRSGASWAAIGSGLGVTRQAAQKRFVVGDTPMDAFTNRAAVVVLKAQNAARDHGHAEVTGLHLILGLLAEWPGIAGQALSAVGVDRDALDAAVRSALPTDGDRLTADHRDFSTGLRKALELAVRESLRLGHGYVGTEHLLLGLLTSDDQPAVGVLAALGATSETVGPAVSASLDEWHAAHSRD